MPTKAAILAQLPPYSKPEVMLVKDQSVPDIIRGVLSKHVECEPYYDRIWPVFKGADDFETCLNLFEFVQGKVDYKIEDVNRQVVSSPQTILKRGSADCKCYSLFIGGVLDAMRRAGQLDGDWCYRFASYKFLNPTKGHVFVVLYPGTADEVWVDAVLDNLDDRFPSPFWIKDRRPYAYAYRRAKILAGIPGRQTRLAAVGNAAGDQLQQQLIEYSEGVAGAFQQSKQTGTINYITEGVLQGASDAVPGVSEALAVLRAGQATINNNFGVGSAAARVYSDLTSLNVVGLFNDLFNGRTYQYQIYWLAAMYNFYVLGRANITNQNQMTDQDVWPAVKWFIDRTGVYISGTELLQALTISTDKYLSYYGVNKGITTDRARVDAAVAVARRYWSNAPINPGDDPGNFAPGTAGSWAGTIGVFDQGIAQIANAYGLTPEQYVHQTGIDYTKNPTGGAFVLTPAKILLGAAVAAAGVILLTD